MAAQNEVRLVGQDWRRKAECANAGLELDQLLVGMCAWIAGPGLQVIGVAVHDDAGFCCDVIGV